MTRSTRFHVPTAIGTFVLEWTADGISAVTVTNAVTGDDTLPRPAWVDRAGERLREYVGGEPVGFDDIPIDVSSATEFTRQVFDALREVLYGETLSYGEFAQRIGRPTAARAVGQAVGRNPLLILIPCHRIVASNGAVGGWSGPLGMKTRLLAMERLGSAPEAHPCIGI